MKLEIQFFNAYKIKLDENHWLDYNIINSFKLAKLLAYFIYHHRRKISSSDLQELMFSEGESNNPANALKTLMYRLRILLKNNLIDYDFILSSHGLYYWNSEVKLIFDVDDFNSYYRLGRNKSFKESVRVDYYLKAFNKYKGAFLPMLDEVKDLIIIRTHLNSQFLNIARYLIEYYYKLERYDIVEELCSITLSFNHNDETINLFLIISLVKQAKMNLAKEHYNQVITSFNNISNNTIHKMKYYLSLDNKGNEGKNIRAIQEDLVEKRVEKAFVCDYDFFKKIYQFEARKTFRKENKGTVALLTIKPKKYVEQNLDIYNRVLEDSSKILKDIILGSLRMGDIVCKYSDRQFLILLDCSISEAGGVIARIKKLFQIQNKYERVILEDDLIEIILANVHCNKDNTLKIQ
ncbi:MAG: hypothetical protein ACLR9T_06825 [Thomasclavelia sp.]|uniref:hypothetical protein n=1 Tax=Thomasclavelia sp. TaxID=3025757 RepID=UPI0039A09572